MDSSNYRPYEIVTPRIGHCHKSMSKPAVRARRTTTTLATTLRRLFKRSQADATEFANDVDLERKSLYALFNGENGIRYKTLEQFERRLGIPTGIILCISHAAALIRDARFPKKGRDAAIAAEGLVLMATYLKNLHDVLTVTESHPARTKYIGAKKHRAAAWLEAIDEVMDATRGTDNPLAPTAFTDPKFASRHLNAKHNRRGTKAKVAPTRQPPPVHHSVAKNPPARRRSRATMTRP